MTAPVWIGLERTHNHWLAYDDTAFDARPGRDLLSLSGRRVALEVDDPGV